MSSWGEFLQDSQPRGHGVQVYRHVDELAVSVCDYLASGFDLGEPAVVIVRTDHWSGFSDRLAARGWSADALADAGLLWLLDSDLTLSSFLIDGRPARERFEGVVGGVLDEIGRRFPGKRVRAFGDMVDLLCERGNPEAAAALEALWEELLEARGDFTLLCGYGIDLFDRAQQVFVLPEVCRSHSHVLPAADSRRFQRVVDEALADHLGADANKVYALAANQLPEKQIPAAQLALMWVSAHMPVHAERILADARRRYSQNVPEELAG